MEATLAPAAVKQQAIKRREDEPVARTGKDPKDGVPGLLLLAYKWRYPLWIQRHHKNGPRHFSRYDHACMFCHPNGAVAKYHRQPNDGNPNWFQGTAEGGGGYKHVVSNSYQIDNGGQFAGWSSLRT